MFVIQLLENSSITFEPLVSVTTGQTPLVEWTDSTLQDRASATGNLDSPSSAQLKLTINKASVQCPTDFNMYMCKMSGYAWFGLVAQETSPIVLSYLGRYFLDVDTLICHLKLQQYEYKQNTS